MAYTKQTWANNVGGATPLNADRLNYIEDGIEAAHAGLLDPEFYATAEQGTIAEETADALAALTAADIALADAGNYYSSTDPEGALQELKGGADFVKTYGGGGENFFTIPVADGATPINLSTGGGGDGGNIVEILETDADYTLTVEGLIASKANSFILIINCTTTGAEPTWFTNIEWIGGTPTISWVSGVRHIFSFLTLNGTDWIGTHWTPLATIDSVTFSITGTLTIPTSGTHRLYNDSGTPRTIVGVRATVGTAPASGALRIDVNKNGSSIFGTDPTNPRPSIGIGQNTSKVTAIGSPTWADGEYLTVDVDNDNSPTTSAALTVAVFYRQGA